MPRKLRALRADLRRGNWFLDRQKGSHQTWAHALVPFPIILSGKDGYDADRYQERDVQNGLRASHVAEANEKARHDNP